MHNSHSLVPPVFTMVVSFQHPRGQHLETLMKTHLLAFMAFCAKNPKQHKHLLYGVAGIYQVLSEDGVQPPPQQQQQQQPNQQYPQHPQPNQQNQHQQQQQPPKLEYTLVFTYSYDTADIRK